MTGIYGYMKKTFRTALPKPVRDAVWSTRNPFRGALLGLKGALEQSATHDEIYDQAYFERTADVKRLTMMHIADSIVRDVAPETLLDVGCGGGYLMSALDARGVNCFGLEYARAGIEICRRAGLDVQQFDLERESFDGGSFDATVSMEVAEHLPAASADRLVELLVTCAPTVVFTAAPPGQGGTDHVNEQPPEYWIEKFAGHGFALRPTLVDEWRTEWSRVGVIACYWQNLMVFSRTA
jgi:SAM-dependent methyltransferase